MFDVLFLVNILGDCVGNLYSFINVIDVVGVILVVGWGL